MSAVDPTPNSRTFNKQETFMTQLSFEFDAENTHTTCEAPDIQETSSFTSTPNDQPDGEIAGETLPRFNSETPLEMLVKAYGENFPDQAKAALSAMKVLVKVLTIGSGVGTDALRCNLPDLKSRIAKAQPGLYRISHGAWTRHLRVISRVLVWADLIDPPTKSHSPLDKAWRAQLDLLGNQPLANKLINFARYSGDRQIAPGEVTAETFSAYKTFLIDRTLITSESIRVAGARQAWNYGVRNAGGWPQNEINPPPDPRIYAIPIDEYPASFVADIAAMENAYRNPSPFSSNSRKVAAITIKERSLIVQRAAALLVSSGVPISEIDSVRHVVEPKHYEKVLTALYLKAGNSWTGGASTIAGVLLTVARTYCLLTDEQLRELRRLRGFVHYRHNPMSDSRVKKLMAFDDPQLWEKLRNLPWRAFRSADNLFDTQPCKAAQLHEKALALEILLETAIRRRNLCSISLSKNLQRDDRKRISGFFFSEKTMKNGNAFQVSINNTLAIRIDKHIRVFRPKLKNPESDFLFSGEGGRCRSPERLAKAISAFVNDELGVNFTPHLIRHIAAHKLIDADSANIYVAQRILGHKDSKTTNHMYGSGISSSAQRKYASIVLASRSPTGKRRQ